MTRRAAPRSRSCCRSRRSIVKGKLEANQHLVAALRDALVERHELIGHEITDVLKAAQITGDQTKRSSAQFGAAAAGRAAGDRPA